jgi:hypothetical protein
MSEGRTPLVGEVVPNLNPPEGELLQLKILGLGFFLFVVLGIEPRASCLCSAIKLCAQTLGLAFLENTIIRSVLHMSSLPQMRETFEPSQEKVILEEALNSNPSPSPPTPQKKNETRMFLRKIFFI